MAKAKNPAQKPAKGKSNSGKSQHKSHSGKPYSKNQSKNQSKKKKKGSEEPIVRAAAKPVEFSGVLNFGMIRAYSKPGSWRRGYGYYQVGQVQEVEFTEMGVRGRVKGNYKDAYTIDLTFMPDGVKATCDCPLEEEWCKHAVAVGLVSAHEKMWEKHWGWYIPDEQCPSDDEPGWMGNYRFVLGHKRKPKMLSLNLVDRRAGVSVLDLEAVVRAALTLQQSGKANFNDAEKREFAVIQLLIKHQQTKSLDGWYHIPVSETDNLLNLLSQVELVSNTDGLRIIFEPDPLKLVMGVNVSMAGNVLISLHWILVPSENHPEDAYPIEDVDFFAKDAPWGIRENHVYRLNNTLNSLPNYLTRTSFTDIRDADGGKFMYEELPGLRKRVEIDEADILEQIRLEKKPPQKMLKLEMLDDTTNRIRAIIDYSYDGVDVPFSKATPETPYVMVVKKDKEVIYWVRRDTKQEKEAYQALLDAGFEPMQTNNLMAEGDHAIDVYNVFVSSLGEDWTVKGAEKLKKLKAAKHPLVILADTDFTDTVDQFQMSISCAVGEHMIDLDEVQHFLMQGQKYFYLDGAGYVEVPLASILQFGKTLQGFDAKEIYRDVYQVKTYKAGLIAELIDQGVYLRMSHRFQDFWERISSFGTLEHIELSHKIKAELRPYQYQGFLWLWFLYSYGLNGILADDMGLGKTLQTLVLLQHAKDRDGSKPTLIVCPTSVVFNWLSEIRRFTPDLKTMDLTGPNRYSLYKQIKDVDVVITSYAILRRDINALKEYSFRHVILDESQNIKNHESQTAQASKNIKANHRLALSGTPIENRLSELWSVFDFLMPGFLYDLDEFRTKYIVPIEERGHPDSERRLRKQVFPFILRRLKRDVAQDLPPKVENIHYCKLSEKQQELYLDLLEKTRDQVFAQVADQGLGKSQNSIFSALLRLRQICCHPQLLGEEMSQGVNESGKFEALQDMVEEIISEGHRILLFSQFVEMLKIMRKWLERRGIPYEYLTGETKNREEVVNRFNRDDNIPIFLISLKAGGTGLNLTGADYVIHYDPWWNPAAEDQATDRAHRIGQTKSVFVYRLIAKGTVEEKIMKLKDRKRGLVDSIISADRSIGKSLSFEDLKEILTPDF
jgi:hypothetical protein